MGSGERPRTPPKASPPARAARPGDPAQTGSEQRRTRLRALSRIGPRASIIAGETGGFTGDSVLGNAVRGEATRQGRSILG